MSTPLPAEMLRSVACEQPLMTGLLAGLRALSACRDIAAVARSVCATVRSLLHCDGATFIIREEPGLRYLDEDALGPLWKGLHFPLDSCICGWSMLNRQMVVIEDIAADPRINLAVYRTTFISSLMIAPVRQRDPVAAIGAYWADRHAATPEEQAALQAVADSVVVALENARLHELARHEIAERRSAEAGLRESEERLRWALANGRLGMWEWDVDADRIDGDGQFDAIIGAALETRDLAGFAAALHPDDGERFRGQIAAAVARGIAMDGEFRLPRIDGPGWIACAGNILPPAEGRPRRLIGTVRDVTARHRLEEGFLQSQKMDAMGRLAGGIAHDFNNLISVIMGYGELVQNRLPVNDPLTPKVQAMVRASVRAAGLTGQLLDFSRQSLFQPRAVDLNRRIREMHGMLGRVLGEHIAGRLDLAPGPCLVNADPRRLDQVLLNLAINARDAMPGGGTLTIATCMAGGSVSMSVTDTGCGMDESVRARLFEPFFTTKGPGRGTGLGLATVRSVVLEHGGRIEVASAPGRGTTFTVILPASASAVEAPSDGGGLAEAPHGSETVLLAEDDDAMRAYVIHALGELGYCVLPACDAQQARAVAAAYGGRIDLLLTDVIMPGESGRQLADGLRSLRPGLPVLFMSGYTDDEVVARGVLHGEVAFLHKPFSAAELGRAVRAVLRTAAAA